MSVWNNLFVGPYAEWLVPQKKNGQKLWETPLYEESVVGVLYWQNSMGDLPEVKRGRSRYHRYTFMPQQERPGKPERQMYFGGQGVLCLGTLDLTEVDRQGEMRWFAEAFRQELEDLAEYLGNEPVMRWGVVEWLS